MAKRGKTENLPMQVYEVEVAGYGSKLVNAVSAAAAKYDAFLCDAFSHMKFFDFIKITVARKVPAPASDGYETLRRNYPSACIPKPGTRIEAEGLTGVVLPALKPTSYVLFQPDGSSRVAIVHPASVALAAGVKAPAP